MEKLTGFVLLVPIYIFIFVSIIKQSTLLCEPWYVSTIITDDFLQRYFYSTFETRY